MARKATRSRSDHARSRNRGGIFGAVLKDLMTKVLRCLLWSCFNNEVVVVSSSLGVVVVPPPPPPLCKGGGLLCVVVIVFFSSSSSLSGKQREARVESLRYTNDVFSLLLLLLNDINSLKRKREKKKRESPLSTLKP